MNTPADQRSISPLTPDNNLSQKNTLFQEFNNEKENKFYEEKRLIEQELELIRRERENLLNQHEKYRQQAQTL